MAYRGGLHPPQNFLISRYLETGRVELFFFWHQCCYSSRCKSPTLYFPVKPQCGEWSCEGFLGAIFPSSYKKETCVERLRENLFSFIPSKTSGTKRLKNLPLGPERRTLGNELMTHCVPSRPDGSAGRQREDVRVGPLPADHLLQKSRQLPSHPDTIQPPGKQGDKAHIVNCRTDPFKHSHRPSWRESAEFPEVFTPFRHGSQRGVVLRPIFVEWFSGSELGRSPRANNFLRWCLACARAVLSGQTSDICLKTELGRGDEQRARCLWLRKRCSDSWTRRRVLEDNFSGIQITRQAETVVGGVGGNMFVSLWLDPLSLIFSQSLTVSPNVLCSLASSTPMEVWVCGRPTPVGTHLNHTW